MVRPYHAAAAVFIAAAPLAAQTVISSYPEATGFGAAVTGQYVAVGQSFIVPEGPHDTITSIRISLDTGPAATGNVRLYIFDLEGPQLHGPPMFRSDPLVDPGAPDQAFTDFVFSGLNVQVIRGGLYLLLVSNVEGAPGAMNDMRFAATQNASSASPFLSAVAGVPLQSPGLDQLSGAYMNTPHLTFPGYDLIVELTAVPAPGAAGLLALASLALGRRRR